jgi:DNA-binding SARP family transcriptional activator
VDPFPRQPFRGGVPRPIPAELTRAALLERFERDAAQLIVLAAPTGYGKTTLLAQYARNASHGCAWVQLSADESDPNTLLRSTLVALEPFLRTVTRCQTALERGATSEALARALAGDLADFGARLDLIFDGCEHVGAVSSRWLTTLAEHLGAQQRLLLSGYDITDLRLARHVARGTAVVLGEETLRFTIEEGVAYLRSRGFHGDADSAFQRCDGWPAGLGLIGAGAGAHLTPDDLVLDALDQLEPALQRVLPELSTFEVWQEDIARVMPDALPDDWLGAVRRAGLPLTPLGGGVYRPHSILRSALERELRQRPERHRAAHRVAAERARLEDAPLQAVEHYRQADDLEGAFGVLREVCDPLLARAEYELIRQYLETWSLEVLPSDLRAALGAAWIEAGEVARGQAVLHELHTRGQANPLTHYVLGKEAARRGDYLAELQRAESGLALEPRDAGWRACERLKGWALLDLGRLEDAKRYVTDLLVRTEVQGDDNDLGATLLLAHNVHLALGERDLSERVLRRALEVYAALDAPIRVAMLRNELADLLSRRLDFQEAQAQLDAAFQGIAALPGEVAAYLHETQGDLYAKCARTQEALGFYATAQQLCARHRLEVQASRIDEKREALLTSTRRPHNSSQPDQPAPLELRITSFGERRVRIGQQDINVSLTKSFELLVYLALHGPSTRETIMDALWDGSREARHQEYFKVAVRRLRAQLAQADAVDFNPVPLTERYAIEPRFEVRLDAHLLEHPDAPDAFEQALNEFHGDFLEGVETQWATEHRDRYATELEAAWLNWGRQARPASSDIAVQAFQRGLRFNPTSETLLLELIRTLCASKRYAEAKRSFGRYKAVLKTEFDLEPDRALLEQLTRCGLVLHEDSLSIPSTRQYLGS